MSEVMRGYKAINIGGTPQEVSEEEITVTLDDVTDEPNINEDVEVVVEEQEVPVIETQEEEVVEEKPTTKSKKPEVKQPSRSEKRIRELAAEKNELLRKEKEWEAEKAYLTKQLTSGTKISKETMKHSLENELAVMMRSLTDAIQNGEAEQAVELQTKMMDVKMQLTGLDYEINNIKQHQEKQEQAEKQPKKTENSIPEKALEWIDSYPQFKTDELFNIAAITVNNQLIKEGYDINSDEFYEEITNRLTPRFPEVFGVTEKNDLEYEDNSSDEGNPDVNANPSTSVKKVSKPEQTVSGGSRSQPHSGAKPRKPNSIVITPEMQQQAKRWGLTMEQMARRVAHQAKNRDGNGYVPIMID